MHANKHREHVMNFSTIDWSTVILVASIVLLVSAVSWKMHLSAKAPSPAPEHSGIGQYRPQAYH
jgi:hypothetical protein